MGSWARGAQKESRHSGRDDSNKVVLNVIIDRSRRVLTGNASRSLFRILTISKNVSRIEAVAMLFSRADGLMITIMA